MALPGEPSLEPLAAHHVRLYNSWKPNLSAGSYTVEATQTVTLGAETQTIANKDAKYQEFHIQAENLAFDESVINSFYPPKHRVEDGRILPHIVFNDAHLPWTRSLALVVFVPADLVLSDQEQKTYNPKSLSQAPDGSIPVKLSEFLPQDPTAASSKDVVRVVFPKRAQIATNLGSLQDLPLLSHVRQVNNSGLPDQSLKEHSSLYSVLISPTSGVLNATTPTDVVVHLLSIDGVQQSDLVTNATDRIRLRSLFSWEYTCTNEPRNIATHLEAVAATINDYRKFTDHALGEWQTTGYKSDAKFWLKRRIDAGYAISQYRTPTGELWTAFSRGPLILQQAKPSAALDAWPASSTTGQNYQIADQIYGLPDLTYALAWQLGKCQALANPGFTTALARFRATVHKTAASKGRMHTNSVPSAHAILAAVPAMMERIVHIARVSSDRPTRISQMSEAVVDTDLSSTTLAPIFTKAVSHAVLAHTSSTIDTAVPRLDVNEDWNLIVSTLIDYLHLKNIPAHYLLPNPSLSPMESIRLFYIDDRFIDCLIDGALSGANQTDRNDDQVRTEIKKRFNTYLSPPADSTQKAPAIPKSFLLLRSYLVKVLPELKIVAICRKLDPTGVSVADPALNPVISHDKIDDTTIRVLLDCLPSDIWQLKIALPAHQQHFAAPFSIVTGQPYRCRYLNLRYEKDPKDLSKTIIGLIPEHASTNASWLDLKSTDDIFSSTTRTLSPRKAAQAFTSALTRNPGFALRDSGAAVNLGSSMDINSSLLACMLNEPSYELDIVPNLPQSLLHSPVDHTPRQIYMGKSGTSPSTPGIRIPQPTPAIPVPPIIKPSTPISPPLALSPIPICNPTLSLILAPSDITSDIKVSNPPLPAKFQLQVQPNWVSVKPSPTTVTPASTTFVFEPVFYIQRTDLSDAPTLSLSSLEIFIPTAASTDFSLPSVSGGGGGGSTSFPTEAFLPASGVTPSSSARHTSRMLRNVRFVPRVSASDKWLRVTLAKRGGGGGGGFPMHAAAVAEASFKMGRQRIVVDGGKDAAEKVCCFVLVEKYRRADGSEGAAYSSTKLGRSAKVAVAGDMYF